ncbi:MAG: protein kinase [Deltaproteobacteria bacterium]|nr:protein kinase [Deltaproteobacteria bacterium]
MNLCLACGRVFDDGTSRCPTDGDELLPYEASRPSGDVVEGGYRIVRLVGVGQCGEVFECQALSTEKRAILRLMAPELTGNRITTELLLRHMMQLREFDHPSVVRVHDVSLHEGRLALVRDWVEGERLLDLQLRDGALTVAHSLDVALQLAKGLEAAHAVDLLHLQLRPSNVFLEVGQGNVLEQARLVDFGIGPQRVVDGRDIFGTIRTLSPEQIEGWDPTPRSDIYSLGLLLHRMITGRQPFAGTGDDVVRQALEAPVPPLESPTGRPAPQALDELVRAMAEKRPDNRPRHMTEVLGRLRSIQQSIEDDLPFEQAFREEVPGSSRSATFRELQTVILRRSSIVPPAHGPGSVPPPPPQELLTPQGAERKRRESLPPGTTVEPAPPPDLPRREAQTIMFLPRGEAGMRLGSIREEARPVATAGTATEAGPEPGAARPAPAGIGRPAAAAAGARAGAARPSPLGAGKSPGAPGLLSPAPAASAAKPPRKGKQTLLGHPAVTAPRRPALFPQAPAAGGPTDYEDLVPSAAPTVEPPLPTSPAFGRETPLAVDPVLIAASMVSAVPVEVDSAEPDLVADAIGAGDAPARPISPEPPPVVAFGLEPGAVLPDLFPPSVQPQPGRRTLPWIAVAIGVLAVAVGVVWFFVLRDVGETAGTAGAPSADESGPAMVAAASKPDASGSGSDGGIVAADADAVADRVAADASAPPADAGEPADVALDEASVADAPADEPDAAEAGPVEAGVVEEDVPEPPLPTTDGGATLEANEAQRRASKHWANVGFEQLGGRQFSQARSSFERSLNFDPRNRQARLGLGRVAFQQGRFAEAVRFLEPIFRGRGYMLLGIAYVRVGRTDDARSQFEKILARDPDDVDAQRALRSLP